MAFLALHDIIKYNGFNDNTCKFTFKDKPVAIILLSQLWLAHKGGRKQLARRTHVGMDHAGNRFSNTNKKSAKKWRDFWFGPANCGLFLFCWLYTDFFWKKPVQQIRVCGIFFSKTAVFWIVLLNQKEMEF